jgi:hypothetical protein
LGHWLHLFVWGVIFIQPLTIQPRVYCSVGHSFFHRFLYCTLEHAASESVCTLLYDGL